MIRLKFIEVIVFYEVPQIFIATDIFDTRYLCLLYPHNEELCYKYLAVRISEKRLNLFKGNIIDLLSIYKTPEDNEYFDVVVKEANDITAIPISANQIQPFMLPDDGFYCNYDAVDNDELISHSLQNGRIMSCIAFSDIENSHNIDVNVLTNALDRYQAMIRNCHIKRFGKQHASEANMRACALQAASFDVHFILNETFDMFGEASRISSTLQKIDEIFSEKSTDGLKVKIEELQGHTLSSMRSFLQVLETNKLSFKHKWVKSTLEKSVLGSTISPNAISRVYEYLSTHTELEEVTTEFIGYFASGTVLNKGKWIFISDKKKITGTTDESNMFNGITLGEHHLYKIKCIEYQEINPITAKPKASYKLIECNRIEEL
ncbi:MAG: hypothetical protein IJE43_11500 [Alphaproteobacteria bacterium]|nr:hypothetical protein [Alphaproteobacteria bacterium]